ncbi:MAG: helix-turn-helix transcriptional regulator [Deltaproteobacteria bacterium]|nr:helix-turn-helix transcriptional regulator [Deltaproteobacteria bacterium]
MQVTLKNRLSKHELAELMTLSYRSLSCRSHDELKQLVLDLHNIFDFNNTLYARANVSNLLKSDESQPMEIYNISYPTDFLQNYLSNRHYILDASIRELVTNLSPVDCHSTTSRGSEEYIAFVQKNHFTSAQTWMHGALDLSESKMVGFSFVGPMSESSERVLEILKFIIPFYSEAFNRISRNVEKASFNLTPREIEVLQWIKEGKSSWDISVLYNCSKRTVDFHVENAKTKLNAVSRAQAVAIALHHGIIIF